MIRAHQLGISTDAWNSSCQYIGENVRTYNTIYLWNDRVWLDKVHLKNLLPELCNNDIFLIMGRFYKQIIIRKKRDKIKRFTQLQMIFSAKQMKEGQKYPWLHDIIIEVFSVTMI